MSKTKKIISTAVCIAMCVVLPIALHAIPNVGSLISPMHVPVFICALVCGPFWGVVCGLVGPFLSSVITQMPPIAYLPSMLVELAVYGFACGIIMRYIKTGRLYADIYISLGVSMVLGRIAAGLVKAFIFSAGSYSISVWVSSYVVGTLPGIIVHLILVPAVYAALKKARLAPEKYNVKRDEA